VWLCGANDWIYRHIHWGADRMGELASRFPESNGILCRALNQAARELLLAQASDWPFIMATGTMVEYAIRRFKTHMSNFIGIYHQITENRIEDGWIEELEKRHNIFPEIDYRVFARK